MGRSSSGSVPTQPGGFGPVQNVIGDGIPPQRAPRSIMEMMMASRQRRNTPPNPNPENLPTRPTWQMGMDRPAPGKGPSTPPSTPPASTPQPFPQLPSGPPNGGLLPGGRGPAPAPGYGSRLTPSPQAAQAAALRGS